MSNYFAKFPTVVYDGVLMKNITVRPRLDTIGELAHNYTMQEGHRVDLLAFKYYDDSNLDWLVYLANDIIDPYYGLYLSDEQIDQGLAQQYGSLQNANRLTAYYQTNWRGDDSQLSPTLFDALNHVEQQFYSPNLSLGGNIQNYRRKSIDLFRSTNLIVSCTLTLPTNLIINKGDWVELVASTNVVGSAEVDFIGDFLVLSNVEGAINGVTGIKKNGTTQTLRGLTTISAPISTLEVPFFERVSVYDKAHSDNELKKLIKLVPISYAPTVVQQFSEIFDG